MSEDKLKALTEEVKSLKVDHAIKSNDLKKLKEDLKKNYKINTIDAARKRLKTITTKIESLKAERDKYIEKAESLLEEYE